MDRVTQRRKKSTIINTEINTNDVNAVEKEIGLLDYKAIAASIEANKSLSDMIGTPSPSYCEADQELRKFFKNRDFNHVINAIRLLSIEAYDNPLIRTIMSALQLDYSDALHRGDKNKIKKIKGYAQDIGLALINKSSRHPIASKWVQQTKVQTMIRRIMDVLIQNIKERKKHRRKEVEIEINPYTHILETYKKHLKHGSSELKQLIKEIKKKEILLHGTTKTIENLSRHTRNSDNFQKTELLQARNRRQELRREIKNLKRDKKNKGHIEARALTRIYLHELTDILISNRSFDSLLSLLNINP